ncbi:MAG: murein biosynthesis integral membrane protein MurJ [Chloroflexi bacterium]|nr:murein biosynthesis integral membrane protein MurJ [Chloroflexota bacterium]
MRTSPAAGWTRCRRVTATTTTAGNPPRRGIVANAIRLTLGNIGSRILGLVREQVVAALFGTTVAASVFSAASRVPTMVYDLLIGGALSSALVPVFAEVASRDGNRLEVSVDRPGPAAGAPETDIKSSRDLGAVAGAVLGIALAVLIPIVIALAIVAEPLMELLGTGFAPEVQSQGSLLVRLALPTVILMGIAAIFQAMLLARNDVTRPAIAPAIYNLGIIIGALALSPWMGVSSLVIGMLVGATGQVLLMWPNRDVGLRLRLDLRHPAVRRILRLYGPVAGGLVVSAAITILDTHLASQTGVGSLAAMRYATTIVQLPLGLVVAALSTASLPVLARYGRNGLKEPGFRQTLGSGLTAAVVLVAPLMVGAMVLREPIVRLLFARGAFDEAGVALTATALLWYAPQLPFVAIDQLLIAAFYAVQNTRVPVLAGVACAGIFATVAITTVEPLGMIGLVLANTVQHGAHATILAVYLMRHGLPLTASRIRTMLRVAVASGTMALALTGATLLVVPPTSTVTLILYLGSAAGIGGAIYLATLVALRGSEVTSVLAAIRARSA